MIDKAFLSTDLFLLTLTVGLYCLGTAVYRRIRMPLLHPVLLTFVAVIVFLRAADIGYARYQEATGILDFALGMSVVALGYLLYEQVEQLRGSLLPVGIATLAGCVAGVLSVVYIAMAFGAGREILNSIAPKSVTVPIAVSFRGRWAASSPSRRSWCSAWGSSAVSSASGSCAAVACGMPKQGGLRWEPRRTASVRRAPSRWEPSKEP